MSAHLDALGAALAVSRVDEDAELRGLDALALEDRCVLLCGHELPAQVRCRFWGAACRAVPVDCRVERGARLCRGENGRVGTRVDACHAADARVRDELR